MSVTYSGVASHPALSASAKADEEPGAFEAQQQMAEMLLELDGTAFTAAADVAKAELAIALQVSFQYAQGLDAHVYSSLSSDRMEARAFRGSSAGAAVLHAGAAKLAAQLLATRSDGEWSGGVRSMRGPEC